jgi:ATP-dependent DNA ligase
MVGETDTKWREEPFASDAAECTGYHRRAMTEQLTFPASTPEADAAESTAAGPTAPEAEASEAGASEIRRGGHASRTSDQLDLRLDASLPNLPDGLRPMLARPLAEAFDSDDHLFEPSWGGLRALAFVGPSDRPGDGDVRLIDADGRDVGARLPELAGLAVRVDARSAILDGELVVVDAHGRADQAELRRRIVGKSGRPVAYLAFDLLHHDGRTLVSQPLTKRRDRLRRILHAGDEVVAVPAIPTEGRALFDAVVAQGIAGVMARQRTSPYLSGVRSRLWRFIAAAPGPGRAANVDEDERNDSTEWPASGPVIALIRRLPLLDDDE